jgi:hypothetical protein
MAKKIPTREDIVKAWKKADAKSKTAVGAKEVAVAMGISPYWIWKRFAGQSVTDMKRKHGIRLSPQEIHRDSDELLSILDRIVTARKGIPGWIVLSDETGIPESSWKKALGGHRGCSKEDVFKKYEEWLRANKPKSPNLDIVMRLLQSPSEAEKFPEASPKSRGIPTATYQKKDARVYGRPLHFGNLTFEPTNEQGVVFLFGIVSKALGFDSIEYLGADFPDCEAKRRVGNRQQLQQVKIEFEFKSSNYDHDPRGCDLIVCWEHNWKECPSSLEVIELKKVVRGLRDREEFRL